MRTIPTKARNGTSHQLLLDINIEVSFRSVNLNRAEKAKISILPVLHVEALHFDS